MMPDSPIRWIIAAPILLLGLVGHVLTLAVCVSIIRQCLTRKTFRPTSGLPLVGPLFFALSYVVIRSSMVLWLAALLLVLELLLGGITGLVIRISGAEPKKKDSV